MAFERPEIRALWDFNNPEESEATFRALMRKAAEANDVSFALELKTQIARTYSLRRMFTEAHATLDEVDAALIDSDFPAPKIRSMLERGRTFNSSGSKDNARPLFIEAWRQGKKHAEHYLVVDAAHMMGIIEPPDKQLEWNQRALDYAENEGDEHAKLWLGSLYHNMAWTYQDMGAYETALEFLKKGLALREEQNDEEGVRIAKWTIARTYRSMNRIDEALEIQHALERAADAEGRISDGYVIEELGELYLLKNEPRRYKKYFRVAHVILSNDPWIQNNEPERLARLKELSEEAR